MPVSFEAFFAASERIFSLDLDGESLWSEAVMAQYKARNAFGIDPNARIHRIFQRPFLEADIAAGVLTLPSASAVVWKDSLENPLANVSDVDTVSGGRRDYGAVVRKFHALCWTRRSRARAEDWVSFSHGNAATRITTTAGKLLDRMMSVADESYMNRTWLIDVEYLRPDRICAMQTPQGVIDRLDSTGASLALSAATVNAKFIDEEEIRLLFNVGLSPLPAGTTLNASSGLVSIPFDWDGFIEDRVDHP